MRYPGGSATAAIAAPIEAIWDLVSDVRRHPELAGSGEVQQTEILGDGELRLGAVFRSHQRMRGIDYITASRVVAWEPPYRFAWRVGFDFAPGVAQVWLFELAPETGGTRVLNGVADLYAMPELWPFSALADDIGRRESSVIPPTLINLARAVGAPPPHTIETSRVAPEAAAALLPPAGLVGGLILSGAATALGFAAGGLLRRRA